MTARSAIDSFTEIATLRIELGGGGSADLARGRGAYIHHSQGAA